MPKTGTIVCCACTGSGQPADAPPSAYKNLRRSIFSHHVYAIPATMIGTQAQSLDHLVGDAEQRWRNGEAEHLSGRDVDDQLKPARLNDWQVGRLLPLEDAAGIDPAEVTKESVGVDGR